MFLDQILKQNHINSDNGVWKLKQKKRYIFFENQPQELFTFKKKNFFSVLSITTTAVLLAIAILFSYIMKVIGFPIVPGAPFLKVEIVDFIFIICYLVLGLGWSLILVCLTEAIRLSFDPNPVGILTLFLCDCLWIIAFSSCETIIRKYQQGKYASEQRRKIISCQVYWKKSVLATTWEQTEAPFFFTISRKKKYFNKKWKTKQSNQILITAIILSVIIVSFVAVLLNYAFILKLYLAFYKIPSSYLKKYNALLASAFLPFNLFKYTLNGILIVILYQPLMRLTQKLKFPSQEKTAKV